MGEGGGGRECVVCGRGGGEGGRECEACVRGRHGASGGLCGRRFGV